METTPLNGQTARSNAPQPAADESDSAAASATTDFKTFLQLLTTQLRNQDPLKPIESTEFVAQLASFSAVEQQVETNDQLSSIISFLVDGPASGLAEWIGRQVRAPAAVPFDGETPVELFLEPDATADSAQLVIADETGAELGRLPIDPTAERVSWTGEGLPEDVTGNFSFAVERRADGEFLSRRPAEAFTDVVEVRRDGAATLLVFADGSTLDARDVKAVRAGAS
ncbi:MAG: flagellar hook capping FlgD N-terminal domain-containing protein [Pseudomonadota bacterium]